MTSVFSVCSTRIESLRDRELLPCSPHLTSRAHLCPSQLEWCVLLRVMCAPPRGVCSSASQATTWVAHESVNEWRATRHQDPREQFTLFVSNVRGSMEQMKLTPPEPPLFVNNGLNARKRAAVRFVSAGRPPMKGRSA